PGNSRRRRGLAVWKKGTCNFLPSDRRLRRSTRTGEQDACPFFPDVVCFRWNEPLSLRPSRIFAGNARVLEALPERLPGNAQDAGSQALVAAGKFEGHRQ